MLALRDDRAVWLSGAVLGVVVLLSWSSGYHEVTVPAGLRWQFSPLGLLGPLDPLYRDLRSGGGFSGVWGWRWDYAVVFAKTCLIELPFYWLALRRCGHRQRLVGLLLANAFTHPAVFFVFPVLFKNYLPGVLSSELFAVLAEAGLVASWCRVRGARAGSALLSAVLIVLANLFSWQIGVWA